MEFKIPVFDTEVDTSDPGESATNIVGAVGGGALLIGIIGAAQYLANRASAAAGVDGPEVPGV